MALDQFKFDMHFFISYIYILIIRNDIFKTLILIIWKFLMCFTIWNYILWIKINVHLINGMGIEYSKCFVGTLFHFKFSESWKALKKQTIYFQYIT